MARQEASVDKAANEIRRLVVNYVYKPGDRLYETILAEELSMSRTPVREALAQMVSCGFLERDENRRGYRIPSLAPQDMAAVFRLRLVLEEHALLLAARRITAADIDALYALNEQEKAIFSTENRSLYAEVNERFHLAIAAKSEDPYTYRYFREVLSRSSLYSFFFAGFYTKAITGENKNVRMAPAHIEHRSVIDALAAKDANAARRLLRAHILVTYAHYAGHDLDLAS